MGIPQAEVPSSTSSDHGSIRTPEVARPVVIEQAEERVVDVRTDDQRVVRGQNEPVMTGGIRREATQISISSSTTASNESPRRKKRKRSRQDVGSGVVEDGSEVVENGENEVEAGVGHSSSPGRKRRRGADGGLVEVTNFGREQRT